ncbi:tyrosine-type recombinase/integrase [Burkholderia ubonensis]|uniref:tyrosine-type recombinase/integrase n=1 Tax=Burkholderia ubonensis TaxID=101571 RepID=UPI0039F61E20
MNLLIGRTRNHRTRRKNYPPIEIKARTKAGHPDVRFHDLRHSAASEMINAGIDLYTVGGVLGHKTTTSTKRYAHLVTDKLAEAVKKIGRRS